MFVQHVEYAKEKVLIDIIKHLNIWADGESSKANEFTEESTLQCQNVLQTFMLGPVAERISTFIKDLKHVKPNAIKKKLQPGLSPRDGPIIHYICFSK